MADMINNLKILIHNQISKISQFFRKLFGKKTLDTKKLFNNYHPGEIPVLPPKINIENATPLCVIMKKYGTDKALFQGIGKHNYTTIYFLLFKKMIDNPIRLFELGIGTTKLDVGYNMGVSGKPGASLRGWSEFFPHADVFAADIDKDILFDEERIKTFYCDQTNPEIIKAMWEDEALKEQFDIIIDDGLHEFGPNICFFENSIHKLKKGGIYVVEDVVNTSIEDWKKIIMEKYEKEFSNFRFTVTEIPNRIIERDNNLIIIEHLLKS